MIEKIVLDYLNAGLPSGIPAYMEKPEEDIPQRYVLIEKTGGGEENYIETATIAIQSYAETLYHAAELNTAIKDLMRDITVPNTCITKATLNTDYNFTDPSKKQYRYQAVYDLVYLER